MGTFWPSNRLLTQALAASLLLHLLVALLLPRLTWSAGSATIETISFVHLMAIEVQTPRPKIREIPAAAPQRAAAPHIARVVQARPKPVQVPAHRVPPRHIALRAAAPSIGVTRPGAVSQTEAQSTSTPAAPVTAPPPEVATATRHDTGGFMPLGAQQPNPVLDPSVFGALQKLRVHVTLIVTVGPDGRTENIDFQPPIDSSIEAQIRTMLASAAWDPAVCGAGVACEGQATIKL
jgi:pyruvate/2-oxoglutarate dehydrogenase complex dihydrolipoamide acyltransferase (E2) component